MGNITTNDNDSVTTLRKGEIEISVYFHFEKLIEKCHSLKSGASNRESKRRTSEIHHEDKLVEDKHLNDCLLDSTLEEIDLVSRNVKYDLRRKMSYFNLIVDKKESSGDLFTKVQK